MVTGEILENYVKDRKGCWNWQGALTPTGYGTMTVNNKNVRAHRFFYEKMRGPIPEKLVIDHLCRNRKCVNPDHLEVVTIKENVLRGLGLAAKNAKKTHCKRGHALSGSNISFYKKPGNRIERTCLICRRERMKRLRAIGWYPGR